MDKNLLIVDDDEPILNSLVRVLSRDNYGIFTASSAEEGLNILENEQIQVVISDEQMPNVSGSEFLQIVNARWPLTIRMMLSGYADLKYALDAVNRGNIYKFITKPWDDELVQLYVQDGFRHYESLSKNRQLDAVFNNALEAILILDNDRIISANPAFYDISGYTEREIINQSFSGAVIAVSNEINFNCIKKTVCKYGKWEGEVFCKRKSGKKYPTWMMVSMASEIKDEITKFAVLFVDITKQKQHEEKIEFDARHDVLTGVGNRLFFNEHLELALAYSSKNNTQGAIIFIGLDRFSHINEALGHDVGDKILVAMAARLKECIGPKDILARFGGDEFVILLCPLENNRDLKMKGLTSAIDKIIDKIRVPLMINQQELHITPSIGCALFPQDGLSAKILLQAAGIANHNAKKAGGNGIEFYKSAIANSTAAYNIESELYHALEKQQMEIFFQPQVSLMNCRLVGAEALLRWQHPTLGLISPNKFIPIAETTGLIVPIGMWVLRQICSKIVEWQQKKLQKIVIGVNLSPKQLADQNIVLCIKKILQETSVPPTLVELEVTESTLISNQNVALSTLQQIKALGVKLSLDDFGTGYSSLSYLKQFPFDALKIDRSFIRNVGNSQNNLSIVAGIINLAKSLNLEIVAEGVEKKTELEILQDLNCDCFQGFYYSPPICVTEFEDLLTRQDLNELGQLGK